MQYLVQLLPLLLKRVGESDDAREQTAFAAWMAVCGDHLRKATAPMRLERKTLLVATMDQTWRLQLQKVSGQFLFRINSILGSPLVTSIEFVINERFVVARNQQPAFPPVIFDDPGGQSKYLSEKAQLLEDPTIRDIFLRAAGKCLDRRRSDLE
jgi:hypothetical protein